MKCILQNKASTSFFHLGWINTFLSWPGFVPLSRISYIIYLMHFATINVLEGPVYYQKDASNTVMVCVKFSNNDKIRQIGKLNPTFFLYRPCIFSLCCFLRQSYLQSFMYASKCHGWIRKSLFLPSFWGRMRGNQGLMLVIRFTKNKIQFQRLKQTRSNELSTKYLL